MSYFKFLSRRTAPIMPSLRNASSLLCLVLSTGAFAQETPSGDQAAKAAELAKKLNNPVAALISVPIQSNWDFGIGEADAQRYLLNVQPVIPMSISKDLNLILRTIVPFISAQSPVPGGSTTSGLGDIVQSFFISPKEPTKGGWIVGAGPVLLYPTATERTLGSGMWGAGPTAVVLKQQNGFTYGFLANQIWSFAGWGTTDVNATFVQPFVSFTTKKFTTFAVNTESTYDWNASQWTIPINLAVTQMLKVKGQILSLQAGYKYYAEKPAGGPDDGFRFAITLVFPK
jgi:hypothetical protein